MIGVVQRRLKKMTAALARSRCLLGEEVNIRRANVLLEPKISEYDRYSNHQQVVNAGSVLGAGHHVLPECIQGISVRVSLYVKAVWPGEPPALCLSSYTPCAGLSVTVVTRRAGEASHRTTGITIASQATRSRWVPRAVLPRLTTCSW